ncbi:hypothetical protein OCV51_10480 [Faecalicatena acetigenes]|uniref:Uncharacterized protein n=1 Tax=Faecalicatena acetigenes TaxID=2981790 RepID=A0ABT2TCV3_9FIRM|nr:hypothetical protein [Faecalicatena acetigenes]MCU6748072.1 hypothetical protein [Faecalicatena acetigenes]SCI24216.1 Uncharacterised protein [uncultured Clostridium sp.]
MRVISQWGNIDIPYERNCISLCNTDKTIIIAWDMLSSSEKIVEMGVYSSEEKAMKAMEMLRNTYTGMPVILNNIDVPEDVERMFERTKMNGILAITDDKKSKIEYVNNMIFQFPKDEEVEV